MLSTWSASRSKSAATQHAKRDLGPGALADHCRKLFLRSRLHERFRRAADLEKGVSGQRLVGLHDLRKVLQGLGGGLRHGSHLLRALTKRGTGLFETPVPSR